MKCKKCGREIGNKKFCGYCGNNNKCNRKHVLLCVVLGGLILVAIGVGGFVFSTLSDGDSQNTELPVPDIREYYETNSDIVSVIDVSDSKNVLSNSEVYSLLSDRGFEDYPISTFYNMNGEVIEEIEIDVTLFEKYPVYELYYGSENDEVWIISVINGTIVANPFTYNMTSGTEKQVLISETDTIFSYDSIENKYYETIPNGSNTILKKVDRIDAETLDTLTAEEIEEL